ncbi:MAG: NB-ARC domain-containing protein [Ardenticatenaceae bacterium]
MSKKYDIYSRKSIEGALKAWQKLEEMGEHPLAELNIVESERKANGYDETPAGYGLALRAVLRQAIESLKPSEARPIPATKNWRPHVILTEQYVKEGRRAVIADELLISPKSTYSKERNRAFDLLADKVREREQKWSPPKERFVAELSKQEEVVPKAKPTVPFMVPPMPSHTLIGRDQMLAGLRRRLFAGDSLALFALNGLPGVGKTALAIALAHDRQIREYFSDGILWAGLGRQPDLSSHFTTWGIALGMAPSRLGQLTTVEEQARAIHTVIGTRRMLLVIDDAWEINQALAFKLGGPNCAHILTTRLPDLAWDFAQEGARVVHELNEADSLALLGQFVPRLLTKQPEQARTLVKAVDGLPLALILMGRYLQKAIYLGRQDALPNLLEELQLVKTRLELTMPQSLLEKQPSLPFGVPISLLASIQISDHALEVPARQVLRGLSVFLPKPNTFSQEAALAVSAKPLPKLKILTEAGLLEKSGPTRYTMHQVIADYASFPPITPITPPELGGIKGGRRIKAGRESEAGQGSEGRQSEGRQIYHQRAAIYFADFAQRQSKEGYEQLDLEWQNIDHAMQWAYSNQLWPPLVDGVQGLTAPNLGVMGFMDARGHWNNVRELLKKALKGAQTLNDAPAEAAMLTKMGAFAFRQADFKPAEQDLTQSLSILEQLAESEEIMLHRTHCYEFLARLEMEREIEAAHEWIDRGLTELEGLESEAARYQKGYFNVLLSELNGRTGRFPEAIAAAEKGLALLPPAASSARVVAFIVLGNVYNEMNRVEKSIEYQKKGIEIAEKLGDSRRLATLWMNLGNNEGLLRSNLSAAMDSYQKALQLYQQLGYVKGECYVHENLGLLYIMSGEDEPAFSHLTRVIHLAETHDLISEEAFAKTNLAHLLICCGQLAEAKQILNQAHQICQKLELTSLLSSVLRWQAEIARLMADHDQALKLIEQSLQIARLGQRLLSEGIGCSIKGKILDGMAHFDEAQAAHQSSLQLLADQSPFDLATSQLAFGEHYVRRDGYLSERAKSLLTAALATFERIGAKRETALARKLFTGADVTRNQ